MIEKSSADPASGASRRRFLAVAGTGAAAAGVAAMVPLSHADASTPHISKVDVDGPLVAFVSDSKTNEVTLMHGEREVVVHDKALVSLLTHRLAKGV